MLLAVRRDLSPLYIETRFLGAGPIEAAPIVDIHHAVESMLLTVDHRFTSVGVKAGSLSAGAMQATSLFLPQYRLR